MEKRQSLKLSVIEDDFAIEMHTVEPKESQNSKEATNEPILDRDDNDDDDNQKSKCI